MKVKLAITAVAASLLMASVLAPTLSSYNKTISTEYTIANSAAAQTDPVTANIEKIEVAITSLLTGHDNAFSDFFSIQNKGAIIESYHSGSGRDSSFYDDMSAALESVLGSSFAALADYSYTVVLTGSNTYEIYVTPIDTDRIASGSSSDASLVWPVYKYSVASDGTVSAATVGTASLKAKSVKYNYVKWNGKTGSTYSYVYYLDNKTFATADIASTYASKISLGQMFYQSGVTLIQEQDSQFYTDLTALSVGETLVIDSSNKWDYYSDLYNAGGIALNPYTYSYVVAYEGEDASGNRIYDFYMATYVNNGNSEAYTSFIYRKGMEGTKLTPVEGVSSGYYSSGLLDLSSFSDSSCKVLTKSY